MKHIFKENLGSWTYFSECSKFSEITCFTHSLINKSILDKQRWPRAFCTTLQFTRSFYLDNVFRIQEKIYHYAYSISLSLPFSRQNSWIRNLGTSFLCGGNDNVNSVGYHFFTHCKNVNVMRLFFTIQREGSVTMGIGLTINPFYTMSLLIDFYLM